MHNRIVAYTVEMGIEDGQRVLDSSKLIVDFHEHHVLQIKRLNRLHAKLESRENVISLIGALKLLKNYSILIDNSKSLKEQISLLKSSLNLDHDSSKSTSTDSSPSTLLEGHLIGTESIPSDKSLCNPQPSNTGATTFQPSEEFEPTIESGPEMEPLETNPLTASERILSSRRESYYESSIDVETHDSGSFEATKGPVSQLISDMDSLGKRERSPHDEESPSSAAIRRKLESIKAGCEVVVLTKVDSESDQEDWILALMIRSTDDGFVEVEDVDEPPNEASSSSTSSPQKSSKTRYKIPPERVLLLSENPESESFKIRERVLALFPGTTCLYPATIINVPSRRKKTKDYLVRFNDDIVSNRPVPSKYILKIPMGLNYS